jgi:uncharacterized delta-60 repeat protein
MDYSNGLIPTMVRSAVLTTVFLALGGCLDSAKDSSAANGKFKGFNEEILAVADAGNGSIYVGGYFSAFNHKTAQGLARVNRDGTLDRGFVTGKGFDNAVYTIATALDGSATLYVGGDFSRYDDSTANNIIRLKSDGSRDDSFTAGKGFDSRVEVVAPARDGSGDIYVGGHFTHYNGIAANHLIRLNRDGSVDEAFRIGNGANGIVRDIAATNDGSGDIYVAGDFNTYDDKASQHIARLNADGSADSSFKLGEGFDREVFALTLANDNSRDIYVGGWFHNYNGEQVDHLVRLTETGELNSRFVSLPFAGEGEQYVASLVAVDNCSGTIYVGGSFSSYGGKTANGLIRLNAKGEIDRHFSANITPTDSLINAMATDINGDLFVGGWLNAYQGEQPNYILHLHEDGSRDVAFNIIDERRMRESSALMERDLTWHSYVRSGRS